MNNTTATPEPATRRTLYDCTRDEKQSNYERLCAELMLLLLEAKCGMADGRADRRLASRRNLVDVVQVRMLALDLCAAVGAGTGLTDREQQQASVARAFKDTAQTAAFGETLRWIPFAAYMRVAYELAFCENVCVASAA